MFWDIIADTGSQVCIVYIICTKIFRADASIPKNIALFLFHPRSPALLRHIMLNFDYNKLKSLP